MANQWLRLWHDMPTDPKWRTIARVSGKPIHLVIAVYVHLLVDASRNVTRGHVDVTNEDLASALDVTEDDIEAIKRAMQGRVLDGSKLSGWESRQVKKEDDGNPETGAKSAAQRKREQRERDKQSGAVTEGHEKSRDVTTDKDKSRPEVNNIPPCTPPTKKPRKKSEAVTLTTWLADVKAKGEKPVSDYKPLWEYAEKVKLPHDFIELAWLHFRDRYTSDEKGKRKPYTDWRGVFLKAVKFNWFHLWFWSEPDQGWRLTTVGIQADKATEVAA